MIFIEFYFCSMCQVRGGAASGAASAPALNVNKLIILIFVILICIALLLYSLIFINNFCYDFLFDSFRKHILKNVK